MGSKREPNRVESSQASVHPSQGFERIVVGTDGSSASERAITWARDLAVLHDARVWVLHVVPPLDAAVDRHEAQAIARSIVEHAEMQLRGLRAETVLGFGSADRELLNLANATLADLVVLGAPGANDGRRAELGSVARFVVDQTKASVLIARSSPRPADILVAHEPTSTSERALLKAKELARGWHARLTVIDLAPQGAGDDVRKQVARAAERTGLVMMSSRDPRRPESLLVGSLGNHVLNTSTASVLLVKESGRVSRAQNGAR